MLRRTFNSPARTGFRPPNRVADPPVTAQLDNELRRVGTCRITPILTFPRQGLTGVGKCAVSYEHQPTDPLSLRERARVRVKYLPLSARQGGRDFCLPL